MLNELNAHDLIDRLAEPEFRARLAPLITSGPTAQLTVMNAYWGLAEKCKATPAQLAALVDAMLREPGSLVLLDNLSSHPEMPEASLNLLLDCGRCIGHIGHRHGPRAILERMASEHEYTESIITLVLSYFDEPSEDAAWAAFVERHVGNMSVRRNLMRCHGFSKPRKAVAKAIFDRLGLTY